MIEFLKFLLNGTWINAILVLLTIFVLTTWFVAIVQHVMTTAFHSYFSNKAMYEITKSNPQGVIDSAKKIEKNLLNG